MIVAAFCCLGVTSVQLIAPLFVVWVIDTAIARKDFEQLLGSTALLGSLYLLAMAASYLQTIKMGAVGQQIVFGLRGDIFAHLSKAQLGFFTTNLTGDLVSRVDGNMEKLNRLFGQSLIQLLGSPVQVVGAGGMLLVLDWRLGIVGLLPAVAYLF